MIETVALADPLTVFGGTLSSSVRDRLDAATRTVTHNVRALIGLKLCFYNWIETQN